MHKSAMIPLYIYIYLTSEVTPYFSFCIKLQNRITPYFAKSSRHLRFTHLRALHLLGSRAMSKEETSQVTKRTTRSSTSCNATLNNTPETTKAKKNVPLSLNDLAFGDESINMECLFSIFPGRRVQITELLRLLGPTPSPTFPLFVHGGASTGKTSVVLQMFRYLRRPFVYSSCRTCHSPRILFESILNQLLLHRKHAGNGYSSAKRCDRPSDFVNVLREALLTVVKDLKAQNSSSKKSVGRINGNMVYLIFDNLELVREWDKGSNLLPLLFGLHDTLKMPEVGIIFISKSSPDTYYSDTGYAEPIPVYFPNYMEDEFRQILMKNQANPKLYSSFLEVVLRPFCRSSRRLHELSVAFAPLFEKYCEPLSDASVPPNQEMSRRLYSQFQPHLAPALSETFRLPTHPSSEVEVINVNANKKGGAQGLELDFHMSISSKYLLISAFIASRNPATLDASQFDSTGGDSRKRRRKCSETVAAKKETEAEETILKGPGTFPLERLLAIFQCITSYDEGSNGVGVETRGNAFMSDVLLQLSSLCNANFISKGATCPLEGATRYRATVSEDMAMKVAQSVKFPLKRYLARN